MLKQESNYVYNTISPVWVPYQYRKRKAHWMKEVIEPIWGRFEKNSHCLVVLQMCNSFHSHEFVQWLSRDQLSVTNIISLPTSLSRKSIFTTKASNMLGFHSYLWEIKTNHLIFSNYFYSRNKLEWSTNVWPLTTCKFVGSQIFVDHTN